MTVSFDDNPFAGFGDSNVGTMEVLGAQSDYDKELGDARAVAIEAMEFQLGRKLSSSEEMDINSKTPQELRMYAEGARNADVGGDAGIYTGGSSLDETVAEERALSEAGPGASLEVAMAARPGERADQTLARLEEQEAKMEQENNPDQIGTMEVLAYMTAGLTAIGLTQNAAEREAPVVLQEQQNLLSSGIADGPQMANGTAVAALNTPSMGQSQGVELLGPR